jgi:hypothetical protein
VGARADLDNVQKTKFLTLLGLEIRPLGRPTRSQSLYRLRYPGSVITPFSRLKLNIRFRGTCFVYFEGLRVSQTRNWHEASVSQTKDVQLSTHFLACKLCTGQAMSVSRWKLDIFLSRNLQDEFGGPSRSKSMPTGITATEV